MLKLIILTAIGKNITSTRRLFNIVKTYLIVYIMILPGFMEAQEIEVQTQPEHILVKPVFIDHTFVNDTGISSLWSVQDGSPLNQVYVSPTPYR